MRYEDADGETNRTSPVRKRVGAGPRGHACSDGRARKLPAAERVVRQNVITRVHRNGVRNGTRNVIVRTFDATRSKLFVHEPRAWRNSRVRSDECENIKKKKNPVNKCKRPRTNADNTVRVPCVRKPMIRYQKVMTPERRRRRVADDIVSR